MTQPSNPIMFNGVHLLIVFASFGLGFVLGAIYAWLHHDNKESEVQP